MQGPATLKRQDAAGIAEALQAGTLSPEQANRLRSMSRSHATLTLGKRLADGTLTLSGMPGEQQGRKIAGTWTPYPNTAGGQYWRTLNYRLHPDGRLCGLPWGACTDAACIAMRDADRPTPDMQAKTRKAMQRNGGSPLIPTTLKTQAKKQAKPEKQEQAA